MESVLQDCEMQAQSGLEGVIHHFGRFLATHDHYLQVLLFY